MEPIVPAEVDLRGLPYMPLDVNRLRDSQLAISASGDEFRAAVLLWCASWNQVPAASLPEDDATLAAYAGYGRDVKGWRKVKAGAMRGFVQCDDGRWYHPVVAEKALEAWQERLEYRDKKDNEAERLRRHREEHKQLRDQLREYGITAPWNAKIEELRATLQEVDLKRTRTEPETRTGALPATAKKGREGKGREGIKDQEQGAIAPLSTAGAADGDADQGEDGEAPGGKVPDCPHGLILDLFAEKLPELAQPRRSLWAASKNADALRSRWRWVMTAHHESGQRAGKRLAETAEDGVAWFGRFFDYVRKCPLLMGDKGEWRADLGWLVNRANFAKVIQGNYEPGVAE